MKNFLFNKLLNSLTNKINVQQSRSTLNRVAEFSIKNRVITFSVKKLIFQQQQKIIILRMNFQNNSFIFNQILEFSTKWDEFGAKNIIVDFLIKKNELLTKISWIILLTKRNSSRKGVLLPSPYLRHKLSNNLFCSKFGSET